jgi:parallel beta-helix repeat protein
MKRKNVMQKLAFGILAIFLFLGQTTLVKGQTSCTPPMCFCYFYNVTNTMDSGPGSLRQAILDANSDNTGGEIMFFFGVQDTIQLFSPLPQITADSIIFENFGSPLYIDGSNFIQGPPFYFSATNSCYDPNNLFFINFTSANLTVVNTSDAGGGSLRRAMQHAEQTPIKDYIDFNIPGQAPHVIAPQSYLPFIYNPIRVDGTTQPANGYTGNAPKIEMDGSATGFVNGFEVISTSNCDFYGLYMHSFSLNAILIYGTNPSNHTIGSVSKPNVLSGNGYGINVVGGNNIVVEGNYLGIDTSGTATLSNSDGVNIDNSTNVTIRQNVISGNDIGIAAGNTDDIDITGNLIGTDITGTAALSNTIAGIRLWSGNTNVVIGGITAGDRNIISGNNSTASGIYTTSPASIIGNFIGTDITGALPLGNSVGVRVDDPGVIIGGSTAAEGNIISGNGTGILALFRAQIYGNYVGTDLSGTAAVANGIGIELTGVADTSLVGGAGGMRNIISGNTTGLQVSGGPDGVEIKNNFIGTDPTGTSALPNTTGIFLSNNVWGTIVGGSVADRNIIAGNTGYGLRNNQAPQSVISHNYIGVDVNGTNYLPNNHGMHVEWSHDVQVSDNKIAGNNNDGIQVWYANTSVIYNNEITDNGGDGIDVGGDVTTNGINNQITQNSIYNNGGKGIDLNYSDTDIGNAGYPIPIISGATTDSIWGFANAADNVELFYSESINANPQGKTYIATVTTDGAGNWVYIGTLSLPDSITATATSTSLNTSEFSLQPPPALVLNFTSTNATCDNSCDGMASVMPTGGASPYTFAWYTDCAGSNLFDTTPTIINLCPGVYFVQVTDNNGLIKDTCVVITSPPPVAPPVAGDTSSCFGTPTPDLLATGTNVLWYSDAGLTTLVGTGNTFSTGQTAVGTYTYYVTQSVNGCESPPTIVTLTITACSNIWPGDINDDGTANNFDFLYMGFAYDSTGTARSNPQIDWNPYPSMDWGHTFSNGVNYKHADCDGNGIVQLMDSIAIVQNYDSLHAAVPPVLDSSDIFDPLLYIVMPADSIPVGDTLRADIYLGESPNQLTDLHGIAFSIGYQQNVVDSGNVWVEFPISFMGTPDIDLVTFYHDNWNDSVVDIALTRFDRNPVGGFGPIAQMVIVMPDDISGMNGNQNRSLSFDTLILTISDIVALDGNQTPFPIRHRSDSILVHDNTTETVNLMLDESRVEVFPNPADEWLNVSWGELSIQRMKLMNAEGKLVLEHLNIMNTSTRIQVDHLPTGMYFLHIETPEGILMKKVQIN